MVDEVLSIINPKPNQTFLDMTFGAGGHSREVLRISPDTRVIALDRDPLAHSYAVELQQSSESTVLPLLGKFTDIERLASDVGIQPGTVDSVLFDVGTSSMQFDTAERGFALSRDGPLDMRMDGSRLPDQPSACEVVNLLSENDLYHIIKKYGEENKARKIANMIVESRYAYGRIETTQQLANIVKSVFDIEYKKDKMQRHSHVATKTFQAIRIFVNNELNELSNGLEMVHRLLKPGGVCVVLSFHSLEDRIAKRHFHGINLEDEPNMSVRDHYRNSKIAHSMDAVTQIMEKCWKPYSKKVITPSDSHCKENPRARSAKLRAAYKLEVNKYNI
ncbi:hypothetical protein LOTGIDRAFT_194513 [Lottia gigantea]|uniref:Uncharacterized protein n=1 Tax=Lottia gigantea TaxID=225164 RepID=V4BDW3_LOTGI|nr:hypothetical protein LOTGIDRAFT_194513 [Lottia gigantea]ESO86964.1 hypothetical protein LOTGIDRAFT_194513 [Lottia gigantea]